MVGKKSKDENDNDYYYSLCQNVLLNTQKVFLPEQISDKDEKVEMSQWDLKGRVEIKNETVGAQQQRNTCENDRPSLLTVHDVNQRNEDPVQIQHVIGNGV